MDRLAPDEPSIPLKDREGTISTPFRKIFAIICLSPVSRPRFLVSGFSPHNIDPTKKDTDADATDGASDLDEITKLGYPMVLP
jgi:hypothetical protein